MTKRTPLREHTGGAFFHLSEGCDTLVALTNRDCPGGEQQHSSNAEKKTLTEA